MFVAQREGYNNTWINTYAPFVSAYAADDTEVTSQEVKCPSDIPSYFQTWVALAFVVLHQCAVDRLMITVMSNAKCG